MAAGLQEGTLLVFGTGDATSYGLIQTATRNNTTERAEAKGADGNTVSIQEYDEREVLSLNYLEISGGTGAPAIGTAFTYDSLTWYVQSISENITVDGFKSVDVEATRYPNVAV